jgi:hypothetical protein
MAIKIQKDGRRILTGRDYTEFRSDMWMRQAGLCNDCGRRTSLLADVDLDFSFHVHHKNGRGMGGGRRDDTFASCVGLCRVCHEKRHL